MKFFLIAILLMMTVCPQKVIADEEDQHQPKWFAWIYNAQPEPGNRVWMREGVVWTERYPSGFTKMLRVVNRSSVKGLEGTVVQAIETPDLEVFIPDLGSKKMVLYFRHGKGEWQVLAEMIGAE